MKKELNVGDYVRSKEGYIGKSIVVTEYHVNIEDKIVVETKNIIKSSPNITDLIKYGDIVKHKINDEPFISEVWGEENNYFIVVFDRTIDLGELNIVSIVTKEQFEAMEYKVGDDEN